MLDLEKVLFSPVTRFITLKPVTVQALARLGINNIRDLLFHRAHSYLTKTIAPEAFHHKERVIVEITIGEIQTPARKSQPTKIYGETPCGPLVLVFFHKIPAFIFSKLRIGSKHIVEGVVELNDFFFQIRHPDFVFGNTSKSSLEPVYPLTYGITNKQLVNYVNTALKLVIPMAPEGHNHLILQALQAIHTDENHEAIKTLAKYELLANQINLALIRDSLKKARGRSFPKATVKQDEILGNLGFTLTASQTEALAEIEADQLDETRMVRMLQGDVGSGKTLVALLTMMNIVNKGLQSVIMAPTDLLASQHFSFFSKALNGMPYVALLTGKTKAAERRDILHRLEIGEILILIGTHAVFQEKVNFKDLAYIVIDEQHRFGVEQRLELISKANMPDLLVMTATPIPRSLTLTLFGDMASSKLTQKPQGRLPILTTVMSKTHTAEVMQALERKMQKGEKIYWVCPLIEKNEQEDEEQFLMDVETRYEDLQKIYGAKVGIVHGKMKNDQKDLAMQRFKGGLTQILVATTVIEVGIDVSDATLMIIENAEKFGLAQLHQLRGRVGRSDLASHAILLYESKRFSSTARARLEIMRKSEDGFYIAEQDLLLRGGGEILGTRQSGEQSFMFADLTQDMELLLESNKYAAKLAGGAIPQDIQLVLKMFAGKREEKVLE